MADQRISQLTALSQAGASATDELPIVDISADETKKITLKDLIAAGISLVSASEIDLAKLNQASTTKLATEALADASITAAKLSADSSIAVQSIAPIVDNFNGRGWFDSSGNLQIYNGSDYSQVVMPTAGIADQAVTTAKLGPLAVTTEKVSPLGTAAYADASISTAKLADEVITAEKIAADTITAAHIAPDAVGTSELAPSAVDTAAIANLSVVTDKLGDGAVTTSKIASFAVTNSEIADATIQATKLNLAEGSISGSVLTNASITSLKLEAGSVTTLALADSSITSAKLAASSVTTAAIASGAITSAHLSAGSVTASALSTGAVTAASLSAGSITTAALADGCVSSAQIQDSAITTASVADASITYAKLDLADGAIPAAKIVPNSITAAQLAPLSVESSELATSAVTTDKIADGAISSAKYGTASINTAAIASSAITTSLIAPDAVTYEKLQNTTATDVLLGRSSPEGGLIEEIPCTLQGRSLLAGATAAEQRDTLGLGTLSTANGTWLDGSSFSGTSSGINTGDQTITLTGAVTGSGTDTFATTLSENVVLEANIATGAVTSAKIAEGAVTALRLADNSTVVVNASSPIGNGAFIGQHWLNTSTAIQYVWDGTTWLQESGITVIGIEDSTPIALNVSYPDPYSAVLTTSLDLQGSGTVWAGPISGDNAAPTFRALESTDLPKGSITAVGAVMPGTGLTIPEDGTGILNHTNVVEAATISGITFDAQGHITAAAVLEPADIPELDASKIGTGSIPTDRIADDAITGTKLADYSTAKLGETLPIADYIGQIFLNPLDKTFFMWDGNVWVPIGISAGEITFAGTYNADTNKLASVTSDGAALGMVVDDPLPSANSFNNSYYVVVSTGGTGTSPAPAITLAPPDILLSNGSTWVEVDVSSTYVAQNASNVAFTPAASLASTTVQNALEEVSNECRNADSLTSGTVAIARGGTGLTSYSKGNLLLGNTYNVLAALAVGTNGQVLTADSAETLGVKWATPSAYVSTVGSTTAALTVTNPTTTPSLAIRTATTAVNGIVQLSDSVSTTSSALAATPTAVKTAYDLAAAALPKAGGVLSGDLQLGLNVGIVYEGATVDAFQTRIVVADPTADHTVTIPNGTGTLAFASQLDDGSY